MPTAPTVDAPSVMPNGGPTQVSAPDAAFGLDVLGKGLEQAGIAADQQSARLAQHAEQFQMANNKAASDEAFVKQLQGADQFTTDFKANNPGIAAYNNLPDALDGLKKQREEIAGTLTNPLAKAMFDADSRRALANTSGELSRFAATQRQSYVLHQANAVKEALTSDTAMHPENVEANGLKLMDQQAFINNQLGLSPEEGDLEARKAYGTMVGQAALVMNDQGNTAGASAFLEAHKDKMDGMVYQQTLAKLRPAILANSAAADGDLAVAGALHGLGSSTGPTQDFVGQIHKDEGSGSNPRSSASGVGQFLGKIDAKGVGHGTWFDLMKDPEFAADVKGKTPQEILAMRQDPDVADRAIMVNAKLNTAGLAAAGLPANPATAGLAHRFGLGGAEALLRADQNSPVAAALGKSGAAVVAANPELAHQTVGQVIQGFQARYGGQTVNATAGGQPSSFDLQGRMQAALANADSIAERTRPGDATYKQQVEQRTMSALNRQISGARDTEFNAYTQLGTAIESGGIQDQATLLRSVPGGANAWNSLPLSQRNALMADMNREATTHTPERDANIQRLNGQYAEAKGGNSQAFLNTDIASMDLTREARLSFLKAQDTLRNKPASVVGDKTFQSVMKSPTVAAQLSQMDITRAKTPDDYYHFAGAIQGELDQWNAGHPTTPPGPKDIAKMVANVSAQKYTTYTYGIPGTSAFDYTKTKPGGRQFDINEESTASATSFLNAHGLPVNAQTIGQYSHERGIIAAQAKARGYKVTPADLDQIYSQRVTANAAR